MSSDALVVSEPADQIGMQPLDIQHIGQEVAIKWEDGRESFIGLEQLRRACPCAGCKGERDVMGNLHKGPELPLSPASFQLRDLARIGTYGVQPAWADGHASGIYTWDYLERLGLDPAAG